MKDLMAVSPSLLKHLGELFSADIVGVSQLIDGGARLHHHVFLIAADRCEELQTDRVSGTCCDRVIKTEAPVTVVSRSSGLNDFECPMMKAEGLEGYLGVPIVQDGKIVAAIELFTVLAKNWTDQDIQTLVKYATLAGKLATINSDVQRQFEEAS